MKVENEILANGTARMKGTNKSVVGVFGRTEEGEWRRGKMENLVKRRVRPIASGRDKRSSLPRVGLEGKKRRRGVRVCRASIR